MVRIPINKRRHLTALFFTMAIFIIGLLLGLLITGSRVSYISNINQQQKLEYDSLNLQYLYISSLLKKESCSAAIKALEENINKLEEARIKLEGYLSENEYEEFNILKRDYILSEIRYWLLAKQTKEICLQNNVLILFFYTTKENCLYCSIQGEILTSLKDKFKEKVLIFSLDAEFEKEPMINSLKQTYGITSLPTLVIEDKVYSNLIEEKQLQKIICSQIITSLEECKNANV